MCIPLTTWLSRVIKNMGPGPIRMSDLGLLFELEPEFVSQLHHWLGEHLCSSCRKFQVLAEQLQGLPVWSHQEPDPSSSHFYFSYHVSSTGDPLLPHVSFWKRREGREPVPRERQEWPCELHLWKSLLHVLFFPPSYSIPFQSLTGDI